LCVSSVAKELLDDSYNLTVKTILLTLLALGSTAYADGKSYKKCQIFNGQINGCGSWYRGKAVVRKDGAYYECDIFNGQVNGCGSWYRGQAVIYKDGAYRECEIFNGQPNGCGSWYQGEAVVYTNK
jgi:hypothetical protein